MSVKLSKSDRSSLIRLASSLPRGSKERRDLIASLQGSEKRAMAPFSVLPDELEYYRDVILDAMKDLERDIVNLESKLSKGKRAYNDWDVGGLWRAGLLTDKEAEDVEEILLSLQDEA